MIARALLTALFALFCSAASEAAAPPGADCAALERHWQANNANWSRSQTEAFLDDVPAACAGLRQKITAALDARGDDRGIAPSQPREASEAEKKAAKPAGPGASVGRPRGVTAAPKRDQPPPPSPPPPSPPPPPPPPPPASAPMQPPPAPAPADAAIEVRGYVLARDGAIPKDAIGYAIPVFATREEAARFCPVFRNRLTFEGAIKGTTDLDLIERGQRILVAPFVWPVTSWSPLFAPTCANLVERYDYAGGRTFLTAARQQIVSRLGAAAPQLGAGGPYIVTAARTGRAVVVYDLSAAPDTDYDKWLLRTIEAMERGRDQRVVAGVVTPGLRDQVRYVMFSLVPAVDQALGTFLPWYAQARAGN